jgi:serine/threonine-protein kinase
MVGQRLGQYLLRRQVGQGGMGAVYEAFDERNNRVVALKVMRAEFTRNREALTRFFNEARAANLIEHPSVVQIIEDGRLADGTAYLAMEFLNGETLSARLRRYQGPMPEIEARRIGWQLSGALAAAHRKSIVHRDLKPGNIMLVAEGAGLPDRVKLLDFGIAKLDVQQLNLEDPMTRTGVIMGTPYYMSPENMTNQNLRRRFWDVRLRGTVSGPTVTYSGAEPRPTFDSQSASSLVFAW